jgi:4'-phosphopantetheinyl transferase
MNTEFLPTDRWTIAPVTPSWPLHDIHLWCADLNVSDPVLQQLAPTLSNDERQRAQRFYFERDRRHFIAGRGILRSILARYLHQKPADLRFVYSAKGKPSLVQSGDAPSLCFNLSHSQGVALYAVVCDRAVGVDIEYKRAIAIEELAERFFSINEAAAIQALPDDQRQAAFFQIWTCKEAYLKATGEGLAGLEQVEISLNFAEPPRLIKAAGSLEAASHWFLQTVPVIDSYVAALVVEATAIRTLYWQWT